MPRRKQSSKSSGVGKPSGRDSSSPKLTENAEYCSVHHGDFIDAEANFLLENVEKFIPAEFPEYEDKIDAIGQLLVDGRTKGGPVFKALVHIGLAALRPEWWEKYPVTRLEYCTAGVSLIRELVWARIDEWYHCVRSGRTVEERRAAAVSLRRVANFLVGDRRGRRARRSPEPLIVYQTYCRFIFRLHRARNLLRVWPWKSSHKGTVDRKETVDRVATACGIRKSDLCEYLGLNDNCEPTTWGRQGRELTARILTARALNITENTVSNILSAGYRYRSGSRK